ncbi:MAG: GNAT family N-acetyltransferase [Coriobacteriia bacterium]|nr:GNAT family N-acetyltransferase [Coriobacteriia bacterium]MCL2537326.1 GNAT family N-acetyltransferase [Coriobacteriia bacterium]
MVENPKEILFEKPLVETARLRLRRFTKDDAEGVLNFGSDTEVLTEILKICFNDLKVNRVEASCFAGNEASGKVQEKCGMKLEGFHPQVLKVKGVLRDEYFYGITRDQWDTLTH